MSRGTTQKAIVLSVLDRLLDDSPEMSSENAPDNAAVLRVIQAAVRRDLQDLLNTRIRCVPWNPQFTELENSLINYGLPDFTAAGLDAAMAPDRIIESIRRAIELFEPRLTDVRIKQISGDTYFNRTFQFRIEATMVLNETKHLLSYESTLEATTGQFEVRWG